MKKIKCKAQRNNLVSPKWCDYVQHQSMCAGCEFNKGLVASKFHRDKKVKK